jgi:hypothetical protein
MNIKRTLIVAIGAAAVSAISVLAQQTIRRFVGFSDYQLPEPPLPHSASSDSAGRLRERAVGAVPVPRWARHDAALQRQRVSGVRCTACQAEACGVRQHESELGRHGRD